MSEVKKYMEMSEITTTDERGRKWYMKLGQLSDMDIEIEDHGCMVLTGKFDFGGSQQGIQCVIDDPDKRNSDGDHLTEYRIKRRLGTVFGSELIRQLITTLGTYSLDRLDGLYYAIYDEPHNGYIRGIAHPTDHSKYVIFKDVHEETKDLDWTKDLKED
jgi:hypothetical protein